MNRKKNTLLKLGSILLLLTVYGCSSDDLIPKYTITYTPAMGENVGKTVFNVGVFETVELAPAPSLDITLAPKMYMGTHTHSTPIDDTTPGDATTASTRAEEPTSALFTT